MTMCQFDNKEHTSNSFESKYKNMHKNAFEYAFCKQFCKELTDLPQRKNEMLIVFSKQFAGLQNHFILFSENTSGETIPPAACMQVIQTVICEIKMHYKIIKNNNMQWQ